MRIWFLSSDASQRPSRGLRRYLDVLPRLLGAAGHDVLRFGPAAEARDARIAPGVRELRYATRAARGGESCGGAADAHPAYPFNIVAPAVGESFELAERLLALLDHEPPPDAIECPEYEALGYYTLQRRLVERTRLSEVPIVVHAHGSLHERLRADHEPRFRLPDWWIGQMELACVQMADAVVSPTALLAGRLSESLGFDAGAACIPYPIASPASAVGRGTPERGEVLFVGRLRVGSGVVPLLASCARLWTAGRDFRLTLIGDDAPFTARGVTMRAFVEKRYGLWIERGRLRLMGALSHEATRVQLRQAWVVVVPGWWPGFSIVAAEAMAAGTPVLANRATGAAELLDADGGGGYLFDGQASGESSARDGEHGPLARAGVGSHRPEAHAPLDSRGAAETSEGEFERQLERALVLSDAERREMGERAAARVGALCGPEAVVARRVEHYEQLIARYRPRTSYPAASNGGAPRPCVADEALPEPARRLAAPQDRATPASNVASPPTRASASETPGLLSVIVPFFNLGAYVRETLDSVRGSAYRPWEIILIDDGSTDEPSLSVLAELEAAGWEGLRIVHTQNRGLAAARNAGADLARGEYLCFLDADDCVEPDYFARAIDVLKRYANVDFVSSWVRSFGERDDIWPVFEAQFPFLLCRNMATAFSVMRRSAFERCGRNKPEVEYALEDHEMWISMVAGGAVGAALPAPLVRYRVRGDSMLQTSSAAQQMHLFDVISRLHPELYRRWGVELFNLQCANGPGRLWNHPAAPGDASGADRPDHLRAWLASVEAARDWAESQRQELLQTVTRQSATIDELRGWAEQVQQARQWLESEQQRLVGEIAEHDRVIEQLRDWNGRLEQSAADQSRAHAAELADARRWIGELESAKAWLEQQSAGLRQTVSEQALSIEDLRGWTAELEKAKSWNAGQREQFERELGALRGACERWQRQGLVRLLTRARLVRRLAAEEKNTTETQRHREEER